MNFTYMKPQINCDESALLLKKRQLSTLLATLLHIWMRSIRPAGLSEMQKRPTLDFNAQFLVPLHLRSKIIQESSIQYSCTIFLMPNFNLRKIWEQRRSRTCFKNFSLFETRWNGKFVQKTEILCYYFVQKQWNHSDLRNTFLGFSCNLKYHPPQIILDIRKEEEKEYLKGKDRKAMCCAQRWRDDSWVEKRGGGKQQKLGKIFFSTRLRLSSRLSEGPPSYNSSWWYLLGT